MQDAVTSWDATAFVGIGYDMDITQVHGAEEVVRDEHTRGAINEAE